LNLYFNKKNPHLIHQMRARRSGVAALHTGPICLLSKKLPQSLNKKVLQRLGFFQLATSSFCLSLGYSKVEVTVVLISHENIAHYCLFVNISKKLDREEKIVYN